jgi:hypothetical protein
MPSSSPIDPAPKRRPWRRFPPEAVEIIRQKKHPVAICDELAALTGRDKRACWDFMTSHGISRPGSVSRHTFDPNKTDELVDYISDHGVHAAALRFGCNPKSLYNWLYRQEHTHLSRDALSLREVCTHLRIRRSEATRWIEMGLLKAVRRESRTGVVSYLIEFDALQKFCKEHRNLLVTRRSSPNRIRFLEEFVFAPKHAELLRTRDSKREAEAFERGEYLEDPRRSQRSA